MAHNLNVAAVQMDCSPATVTERLSRAAALIAEAAGAGAQLVTLPELFNTGYEFHERNYALAEPLDGETVTWMKAQAAQHNIHLAGTMLLLDETDVFNAALLVAPDGRLWRYDKRYVPFWERAYFRNGEQITVAETDLGKLGMLICWDQWHPDLWAQYAGHIDAMLVMSCPGDIASGDLIFPDGFRAPFMNLAGSYVNDGGTDDDTGAAEVVDATHPQAAWMRVPVVESAATGIIRTKLPLIEGYIAASPLADRAAQGPETWLECGFPAATQIVDADGIVLARGTETGDGLIFAEVAVPDSPPQPEMPQPAMNISLEMYALSDEVVPAMMIPLYKDGLRRAWGSHRATD